MIYFFVAPLLFSLANHMKHLTIDSETITVKCEGQGRISTSYQRGGILYKGGAKPCAPPSLNGSSEFTPLQEALIHLAFHPNALFDIPF